MHRSSKERAVGVALTAASAALFGLLPLWTRSARAGGFSPEAILVFRFAFAAAASAATLLARRRPLGLPRRSVAPLAFAGLAGYAGTALLLFLSYERIPSGASTTIHFLFPAIVAGFGLATGRERPAPTLLGGIALGLAGLALAVEPWKGAFDAAGVTLAVGSAFTYALYIACVADPRLAGLERIRLALWIAIFSGAGILAWALPSGRFVVGAGLGAWLAMAGMGLFSTFLAIAAFAQGIRLIGPTTASILSTFEPLTALAMGILFLGERPGPLFALGAAMILASALVAAAAKRGER